MSLPEHKESLENDIKEASKSVKERKLADGYRTIYANNTQVRTSIYDVAIDFGQVVDDSADGNVVVDQCKIFLSPVHAKALAMLLLNSVIQYGNWGMDLPDTVKIGFDIEIIPKQDRTEQVGAEADDKTEGA